MPQFLITALGSYGDVHPMAGLGRSLAARGHGVKIITNPYFADVISGAGLELVPLGTREEYVRLSRHPDLWHPIRGPKLVLSIASAEKLQPLYELLMANYVPGETVFCAHVMDLASRVAGEKLAAPVASVVFAPGVLWSIHDSPRLKRALLGPRVPRWLKRLQFWMADRWFVLPLLGPQLNSLRRDLGLPATKRVFNHWLFETDLVLGLFPDWFGPPQPDWPANVRMVGFPLWDSPGSVPIFRQGGSNSESPERKMGTDPFGSACKFLAAGSPPIAFSPGSANNEAHQFFEAAVEACTRLGRRGILLTKYDHQLPAALPDSIGHFGFVPMSKLLPHTAALVHHGGIGSCAQGLAAGVPHIVRPMSYDQFDNSRRLVRLGVAQEISVRRFSGRTVAETLAPLLSSPTVAARCREFAARCHGPTALAAACDALEQLAGSMLER
jgi:rhamnosyltransferase subunit B